MGVFDIKIVLIVNDGLYYVIWMDRVSGVFLVFYDGGFDFFFVLYE